MPKLNRSIQQIVRFPAKSVDRINDAPEASREAGAAKTLRAKRLMIRWRMEAIFRGGMEKMASATADVEERPQRRASLSARKTDDLVQDGEHLFRDQKI